MKKRKFLFIGFFALAITGVFFFGCKKDTTSTDSDTSSASDNALAERTYNDVEDVANEAGNSNVSSLTTFVVTTDQSSLLTPCATVMRDTVSVPHRITIDFGSSDCLCLDGVDRRGKIIVLYSGHYRDVGMMRAIYFDSFFVDDNQIKGTKIITNNGLNAKGHLTFSISVNGTIILANSAGTITWLSTRTREWIAGESTITRSDDEYLITGTTTGTRLNGNSYTATITNALDWLGNCIYHEPVSGTIVFNITGKVPRTLDYGTGTCDREATVTINGKIYNIILR